VTTPSRLRLVRRAAAALVGGVVLSVVASACQGTALAAITVNGHVITESALTSELQDIAANTAYVSAIQQSGSPPPSVLGKGNGTFDMAFTDKVLTRQVLLELVHEEVLKRKLVVSAADVQAAATDQATAIGNDTNGKPIFPAFPKSYQDLLSRRAAEVTALQDSLAGITIDDPTIQKYYAAHTADFVLNCVSVIQLATQATADQTRAKVTAPGADYAAIARQVSTDAQSATSGGDLGCQPVGAFSQVPGVDAAVAALSVGQVSPVIPVQGTTPAFALFKLTDRKPQALTAVRTQVIAALHKHRFDAVQLLRYLSGGQRAGHRQPEVRLVVLDRSNRRRRAAPGAAGLGRRVGYDDGPGRLRARAAAGQRHEPAAGQRHLPAPGV
jgi:hypothetical protein